MLDKILHYDEPHELGGNSHVTLTEQQAINWARKVLEERCPQKGPFTDKDYLDEFIITHWAYYERRPS